MWTLHGQVLAEGAPASGAHVAVFQFPPKTSEAPLRSNLQFNARCDGEGRFHVDGLRPGLASVSVRLNGYVLGHGRAESPGEESIILRLERMASIRGRLDWLGPPSRHEVSILPRSETAGPWETWTRIGQEFAFDGLPPGLYAISVEARDVELVEPREIRVEARRSHDLVLTLRSR